MKAYKVEIYKTLMCQWRWRIKADNGRIIGASSESFKNRTDCHHNARLVKNALLENYLDD